MAYRAKRGMGAVDIFGQRCTPGGGELGQAQLADWSCPAPQWWMKMFGLTDTSVAVAAAPTGAALTTPPASGAEAEALVQSLSDQQLAAQQAANAQGVRSGLFDQAASALMDTTNAFSMASVMPWIIGGVLVFAIVAVGGGSPRRYGR